MHDKRVRRKAFLALVSIAVVVTRCRNMMSNFTIRKAKLGDLESLVYQRRKLWEDIDSSEKSLLDRGDQEY